MFKQISTVVHDDDTGYRLPTPLTQGMESSKTQCGMDPVFRAVTTLALCTVVLACLAKHLHWQASAEQC